MPDSASARRTGNGRLKSGAQISRTRAITRSLSMRRSNTTRSIPSWPTREPSGSPYERSFEGMANPAKPASSASFALFVLFAINLLNFFDRQLLGALGEPIRKEFHLSDTALGLLGTVATLMYALVGLPLGRLADRWPRTRLIAIGTASWSLL